MELDNVKPAGHFQIADALNHQAHRPTISMQAQRRMEVMKGTGPRRILKEFRAANIAITAWPGEPYKRT